MKTQANSFACKVCGEVYTEESGAHKGFTCENCKELEKIIENIPIPNPKEKGKRFICGWRRYKNKLIKAIIKYEEEK